MDGLRGKGCGHGKWVSMEKPAHSYNSSVWEGWKSSSLELELDRYLLGLFEGKGVVRIFNLPFGSHPACWECPGKPPQEQPLPDGIPGDPE